MVARRKRLIEKPAYSHAGLLRRALLIRTLELLKSLFYKKQSKDEFKYSKRWEREKVSNFSLASAPLHSKHSPADDIHFSSWDSEKVFSFGLSKTKAVKKFHHHKQQLPKEKVTDEELTPKIAPVKWKRTQNQGTLENEKTVDDFFKILGYE
jgi:hypothetical protein